jgi:hypothetical protein
MPSEQSEEKSLQMLIGEQLSTVTFVQDYLQLHFDGPRLTVFSHPVIRSGEQTFSDGKPGFRDALCNNIAKKVTEGGKHFYQICKWLNDKHSTSRHCLSGWRSSHF